MLGRSDGLFWFSMLICGSNRTSLRTATVLNLKFTLQVHHGQVTLEEYCTLIALHGWLSKINYKFNKLTIVRRRYDKHDTE